jgi:hypothetical protein
MNMPLDETTDHKFATKSETVWPTTLLGDILEGRQKNAERRLHSAIGLFGRELWSKVIIEYSYAIAADRAGKDDHCKLYSQRAIILEDQALKWDADHGR